MCAIPCSVKWVIFSGCEMTGRGSIDCQSLCTARAESDRRVAPVETGQKNININNELLTHSQLAQLSRIKFCTSSWQQKGGYDFSEQQNLPTMIQERAELSRKLWEFLSSGEHKLNLAQVLVTKIKTLLWRSFQFLHQKQNIEALIKSDDQGLTVKLP